MKHPRIELFKSVTCTAWLLFAVSMHTVVLNGNPIEHLDSTGKTGDLYFPPAKGNWETVSPEHAGWDPVNLQKALDYAGENQSSGVVVLYKGRILAEQYWEVPGGGSARYREAVIATDPDGRVIEDVASAQKSVTAILVGIAQYKGLLQITDRVDQYLGKGWSQAAPEQEQAITIRHLITMTTGLTERGAFEAPAGTKWRYNSTIYAMTMEVLEKASGMDRNELTRKWLTGPLGMGDSRWEPRKNAVAQSINRYGFASTARDLARFGLMMLANGAWDGNDIVADKEYLQDATTSSQDLNPYYGYLWWLNRDAHDPGKPRIDTIPTDTYSANGALIRRCYVVPGMQLVVTRIGDQPAGGRDFDRAFWERLMAAVPRKS